MKIEYVNDLETSELILISGGGFFQDMGAAFKHAYNGVRCFFDDMNDCPYLGKIGYPVAP